MLKYIFGVSATLVSLFPPILIDIGTAGAVGVSALAVSRAASARQAGEPHRAGETDIRIVSGGIPRHYRMYVPESHDHRWPLPVVFDFHGSGSDPAEEMLISGMKRAAEDYGFALLMPVAVVDFPSGGHTWNVPPDDRLPDDVRFALDVLDDAAERVSVDRDRVYLTGFSGGARLASEIACTASDRVAAIGAVGGLRSPPGCARRPVPVVAFHGTGDPINPYFGGGSSYWDYGVKTAVRGWAAGNGCTSRPVATRASAGATRIRFRGCRNNAEVVLYRIEGGGHTWPGSDFPFPEERFGAMAPDLDATGLMLDFFARHGLSSRAVWSTRKPR